MAVHDDAPQYNKSEVGGVGLSGLMRVKQGTNAAAQIHSGSPTTKSYSAPGAAKNASFDQSKYHSDVHPSMKGLPLMGSVIASEPGDKRTAMPSNRSNFSHVGD
jgi:hypothetical protein